MNSNYPFPVYYPTGIAAKMLGMGSETLKKFPVEVIPYILTPSGKRRYNKADLDAYKRWCVESQSKKKKAQSNEPGPKDMKPL